MDDKLFNQLFQLKFGAKQLEKSAKKCEKEEAKYKKKCADYIKKGNLEGARIVGQDAIRKKNEGLNYLRLASRLDGVRSRIETAAKMNQVSKQMAQVLPVMSKAMDAMDVSTLGVTMEQFEKQFEDIEVKEMTMHGAFDSALASQMPENEVDSLIKQVADENTLELGGMLEQLHIPENANAAAVSQPTTSGKTAVAHQM